MTDLRLHRERKDLFKSFVFSADGIPAEELKRLETITSQWDDAAMTVSKHGSGEQLTVVVPLEDADGYTSDLEEAGFVIIPD